MRVGEDVDASPEYTRGVPRDQLVGNWYAGAFTYDITSFGEDNDHYLDLLGRAPSAGEIAYWAPKEVESDVNAQVLIAATPEYRSLAR